jgi:cytochrome c
MPYYPTPGTLNADETYAVTAYILHLNNIIGENEMMNQVTLPKVKMPNRNGFITDPRPDVHTPISPAPSNATKEKP